MIQNTSIEGGLDVGTIICNCGEGAGQLQVGNTVRESAQSHGGRNILSFQCCDTEAFRRILVSQIRADIHDTACCDNIHRPGDTLTNRGETIINSSRPGVDGTPSTRLQRIQGYVIIYRSGCFASPIQSGSKCRKNLEGRSRISGGIRCTVQRKIGCLFTAAGRNGLYLPGPIIHDDHTELRLQRDGIILFVTILILWSQTIFCQGLRTVGVNGIQRLLLRIVQKIIEPEILIDRSIF